MILSADLTFDSSTRPETVMEAIDTVVEPLRSKPVDKKTLDRSLVKLRSSLYDTMGQLGGFGLMDLLASFALFDDDPNRVNSLDAEFRKVTPALVQKTAQEYLRPGNRTVVLVEPSPKDAAAAPAKNE
jgi:predicted Zn-dependent peptidase